MQSLRRGSCTRQVIEQEQSIRRELDSLNKLQIPFLMYLEEAANFIERAFAERDSFDAGGGRAPSISHERTDNLLQHMVADKYVFFCNSAALSGRRSAIEHHIQDLIQLLERSCGCVRACPFVLTVHSSGLESMSEKIKQDGMKPCSSYFADDY